MRHRLSLDLTDVAVTRGKYKFGLDLPFSPPTSVYSHHAILIGPRKQIFFSFHAIKPKILLLSFFMASPSTLCNQPSFSRNL